MHVIIIGGVAAGASAAARLRRLDEHCEITLFERGEYISYANCGLPYHLGGVIQERDSLMVTTPDQFSANFNVDVRTGSEVVEIDRAAKEVVVSNKDGTTYRKNYDKLIIATGSSPVIPDIPGVDLPAVNRLWTIPDLDGILERIDNGAKRALVIGGGFIGIEAAENLVEKGLEVTLVEFLDQVLPTLDAEMTTPLANELSRLGITLLLGKKVTAFKENGDAVTAILNDNQEIEADLAIMAVGVRPNSRLAGQAGLDVGVRGHIVVNDRLRTSDPNIYAAGDVVEIRDPIFGGSTAIPLAGPANRQGRTVANTIAGRESKYFGTYGASVVKVGVLSAAGVGATEKRLKQAGVEYRKIYLNPLSNAGYYPGGAMIHMKFLFAPDGLILGAQAVGVKGADKRIDVIATAMRSGMNVYDLADLELTYAPPFNSARDPVNMAGMIASNLLDGDTNVVYPDAIPSGAVLVDVRDGGGAERIPGAISIPLGTLRQRLHELDRSRPIVAYCQIGLRAYVAERILRQHGFEVKNLSGGYTTWRLFNNT